MRALLLAVLVASTSFGAVTGITVVGRSDVMDGASCGSAGPYERIVGKAHFAVDPKLPANRIITDIDYAPRNARGMVEFSADIYVLKPRDPAKGNGTALLEISNRGHKGLLTMFDLAPASGDPRSAAEFGDKFLLDQGYTLVWVGWQFDVPHNPELLRLYTPIAKDGDQPITGLVRADFVLDRTERSHSLADRNHIAYPVLNPDDPAVQLTERDHPTSPRRIVPRSQWQFARDDDGKPVPDLTAVYMASGFEPGKIYEIVYTAKDPPLAGLGPAAVRDFISFLKYGGPESLLGDQHRFIKRAIGFGTSQSGRFLRTFLYYGFNADENGREVFDGVWSHVAGAARGSFNLRFAQPSRDAHPFMNFFYPVDIFPFTGLDETDPETHLTDGILDRASEAKVVPKIFYTNGSYEYWGRTAALIHATIDGKEDAPLAPGTRIYFLAGTQHGPNAKPVKHDTQNLANPTDYRWVMRALLVDMNAWLQSNTPPPESRYPRIAKDQLVPINAVHFPRISGVAYPKHLHHAYRVDYGPKFRSAGIISIEPPNVGKPFPGLVPQVDDDGIDEGGVRLPEVAVPLATFTGWNLRDKSIGAPDMLYSMVGSMIPFARTKSDREKNNDPRPSIEERYPSRADYLQKVSAAATVLAKERLLLGSDVEKVTQNAAAHWDQSIF
ncbi:MAG TPA: alpha/beta hydrolase domain-containing protein [Bryobacteraceae bacterium]|nr:alpha/beta hydrolase domain-containing protein [Bryobacteraceae bacterium]